MQFSNLTPHSIVVLASDGSSVTLPPSGAVARVQATVVAAEAIGGVETYRRSFGEVVGLPAPQEGVAMIVSALVAQASPRADVFSPGELVRGEDGQPKGCRGLTRSL